MTLLPFCKPTAFPSCRRASSFYLISVFLMASYRYHHTVPGYPSNKLPPLSMLPICSLPLTFPMEFKVPFIMDSKIPHDLALPVLHRGVYYPYIFLLQVLSSSPQHGNLSAHVKELLDLSALAFVLPRHSTAPLLVCGSLSRCLGICFNISSYRESQTAPLLFHVYLFFKALKVPYNSLLYYSHPFEFSI